MSYPVSKSKRIRKELRKNEGFRPQLTSFVDMMTVLLIYLLQSFSAEGDILPQTPDLILPESSADKKPELTAVLTINNNWILAENEKIASVEAVLASDELLIPQLNQWLENRRLMTQRIEQYSTTTRFKGDITIQADKRIKFLLLKKIMYTCGRQEYNNFNLAVRKRGE